MYSYTRKEDCVGGEVELRLDSLVIHRRLTAQRLRSDGVGYRGGKHVLLSGEVVREMLSKLADGVALEDVLPTTYQVNIAGCTGCEGKPDHVACTLRLLSSNSRRSYRALARSERNSKR